MSRITIQSIELTKDLIAQIFQQHQAKTFNTEQDFIFQKKKQFINIGRIALKRPVDFVSS